MLIRNNPSSLYRPRFVRSRRGWLLVTRHWILATGLYAACWS